MKRLCIFMTYDIENIVDDYIGYMLKKLRKVTDLLIVVCNYGFIAKGIDNVKSYADKIYFRENIGFDAGAYKDALCHYLGWNEVYKYDELLLANDSYYGPFYPFEDLFDRMEGMDVDYWGLTRSPKGKFASGRAFESHIQSYFFVVRRKVLSNKIFRRFWEKMEFPMSLTQAITTFEFGLNKLLQELGYTGIAVMELCPFIFEVRENENPYIVCPLELIRDAGIPVLKRKSLVLGNVRFDNVISALQFIETECRYDTNLISKHLLRIGKEHNIMGLDAFYAAHRKIFIYGAGLYGRNLAKYFSYKGWTFEKFLVTNLKTVSEACISFDEADIAENDGIIIAVSDEKAFQEIASLIEKRCSINQIFNPDGIIW